MALNKRPTFANRPSLAMVTLVNADGTNFKDILAAGASGNKVLAIFAAGEATVARDIQVGINRAAGDNALCTTTVPINAGRVAATPPKDLIPTALRDLLPKDADAQTYLFIQSGDTIRVRSLSNVTLTDQVTVYVVHATFDDEL